MSEKVTSYIRGTSWYCKLLGDPVLNYNKDGKEWTIDVQLDPSGVKQVKSLGLGSRIKNKDNDMGDYLHFKQSETITVAGEVKVMDPPKVVDSKGNTWDPEKKIGNGSVIDVKFEVKDYGVGKQKGVYLKAVRVLKHVPYEPNDFAPLSEDDEFFAEGSEDIAVDEFEGSEDFLDDDYPG